MSNFYVTFKKNGILKRGVLSESQYKVYSSDNSVSNLEVHPSQKTMEEYYNISIGKSGSSKSLLLG